jgi:hypothetical protein
MPCRRRASLEEDALVTLGADPLGHREGAADPGSSHITLALREPRELAADPRTGTVFVLEPAASVSITARIKKK